MSKKPMTDAKTPDALEAELAKLRHQLTVWGCRDGHDEDECAFCHDPRVGYVGLQVDRVVWDAVAALLSEGE